MDLKDLRFHYGGTWGHMLSYVGGEHLDMMGVDANSLTYQELVDELNHMIPRPPNTRCGVTYLSRYMRRTCSSESYLKAMWAMNKKQKDGFIHCYLEFPPLHSPPKENVPLNKSNSPLNSQSSDESLFRSPLGELDTNISPKIPRKCRRRRVDYVDLEEEVLDIIPIGTKCWEGGTSNEEFDLNEIPDPSLNSIDYDNIEHEDDFVEDGNSSGDEGYSVPNEPINNLVENTFEIDPEEDIPRNFGGPPNEKSLYVGKNFENVTSCKDFLIDYCIRNKFAFTYVKNEPKRLRTVCRDKNCKWACNVWRKPDGHTMRVNLLVEPHTCRFDTSVTNPKCNAKWIARKIEKGMRLHHKTYTPSLIIKYMWRKHFCTIKYWLAWHARVIALQVIYGNYDDSYRKVSELCRQILLANPGSIASYEYDEETREFSSLCIAFKACFEGFVKGCRPIIGLDGCHLKGKYGGVLLCVIGLDANNGMFPLAIYICPIENNENWKKFLQLVAPELLKHPLPLTVISDRQKGLIEATKEVFRGCSQRFCFRHMYKNMKSKHRGERICRLAWEATRAYKKSDYKRIMDTMGREDPKAREWLLQEDPRVWSKAFMDRASNCEHITNNFTESFNSWILELRDKPICLLVDQYMLMLMTLFHKRRAKARQEMKGDLVTRAEKRLDNLESVMNVFELKGCDDSDGSYLVMKGPKDRWEVNLQRRSCTCEVWQLSGIPCAHTVRAIHPLRHSYTEYCSKYVTAEAYKVAYTGNIRPCLPECEWEEPCVILEPPKIEKASGRPKKLRRRSYDEGGTASRVKAVGLRKCSRCGSTGHNKLTCKRSGGGASKKGNGRRKNISRVNDVQATQNSSTTHGYFTTLLNTPLFPNSQPTFTSLLNTPMFNSGDFSWWHTHV